MKTASFAIKLLLLRWHHERARPNFCRFWLRRAAVLLMYLLPHLVLLAEYGSLFLEFLELISSLIEFYEATSDLAVFETLGLGDDVVSPVFLICHRFPESFLLRQRLVQHDVVHRA